MSAINEIESISYRHPSMAAPSMTQSQLGPNEPRLSRQQRLSDVGVAFGQQITARMGLKLPASQERIVEQTRWLYLRYVFAKLRQNSLPLRDLNLTKSSRARRAAALGELQAGVFTSFSAPASALPRLDFGTTGLLGSRRNSIIIDELVAGDADISQQPATMMDSVAILGRNRVAHGGNIDANRLAGLPDRMSRLSHSRNNLPTIICNDDLNNNGKISSSSSNQLDSIAVAGNINGTSISINSNIRTTKRSATAYQLTPTTSTTTGKQQLQSSAINTSTVSNANRKYIMDPTINNHIFSVIANTIKELRDFKPEYYGDTIYELIGIDKFSTLQSLLDTQMTICREMTRSEITWCRICALFSLFGAMSLDCVRLGAPEHVGPILDSFIEFVERDLALWISQQGGWESFLYKYRSGYRMGQMLTRIAFSTAIPAICAWIYLLTSRD